MKRITILSVLILLMMGCNDEFLDKKPNTSMVVENFYKTPTDAQQALTSVYNMLMRDDYWSSMFMSETASDNCAGGTGSGDGTGAERMDRGLANPDITANQILWNAYYGAIYRANTYIENEKLIDWTGKENLQKQYLAEARFLRAYFHFYLARLFGEIPALPKTIAPNAIPPRTPAEELYTFILDDLKYCVDNGLQETYPTMKSENWGRATKWAAEAMIGRVYLFYTGYYNKQSIGEYTNASVLNYVEDVIKNSGHDLVPKFASLWIVPSVSELGGKDQYAGEVNPEVVWSITFNVDRTYNTISTFHRMIGPRNTNVDPYGQGWGSIPVVPRFWQSFDNADPRKTASILSWDDEGLVYDHATNGQAQYTGYNVKKYCILAINNLNEISSMGFNWQNCGYEDYMVMRFADVLLMGAELRSITNSESDATALGYLNRVRERAFGNQAHNYSSASVDNILKERRFELAFEDNRFWDITRSCKGDFTKLVPILTNVDDTDGGNFANDVGDTDSKDVDGNNFVDKKGLFKLPQAELDLMNGVIQQNPGY
jgi:starch-binding outer membrane protein, SusD/RagB family